MNKLKVKNFSLLKNGDMSVPCPLLLKNNTFQINIENAWAMLKHLALSEEGGMLTSTLIKDVHFLIGCPHQHNAGEFSPEKTVTTFKGEMFNFRFYPENEWQRVVDAFICETNGIIENTSKEDIFISVARIYESFMALHLFPEGNDIVARLIASYIIYHKTNLEGICQKNLDHALKAWYQDDKTKLIKLLIDTYI